MDKTVEAYEQLPPHHWVETLCATCGFVQEACYLLEIGRRYKTWLQIEHPHPKAGTWTAGGTCRKADGGAKPKPEKQ